MKKTKKLCKERRDERCCGGRKEGLPLGYTRRGLVLKLSTNQALVCKAKTTACARTEEKKKRKKKKKAHEKLCICRGHTEEKKGRQKTARHIQKEEGQERRIIYVQRWGEEGMGKCEREKIRNGTKGRAAGSVSQQMRVAKRSHRKERQLSCSESAHTSEPPDRGEGDGITNIFFYRRCKMTKWRK